MDYKFFADYTVPYASLKPDLYITFPRMMELIQETSISHTESTPYPMSWFSENNFGFLLVNWQVEVYTLPKLYEKVRISTWPFMFKGILAERCFEVVDEKGGLVARANSKWVFTDLTKRKPVRPFTELLDGYGSTYPPAIPRDYSLPDISGYKKISTQDFTVTRRDIDSNAHVNNIRYIEWAVDQIPDEVYDDNNVKLMKALYKKECVRGERVQVDMYQGEPNQKEFIAVITKYAQAEEVLAHVYLSAGRIE